MKKVYILVGNDTNNILLEAFSTEEKANEYRRLFSYDDCEVVTCEINPTPPAHPKGKYPFYVYVRNNKSIDRIIPTSIENFIVGYRTTIDYFYTNYPWDRSVTTYKMCICHVFAKDKDDARTAAQSMVDNLIAQDIWKKYLIPKEDKMAWMLYIVLLANYNGEVRVERVFHVDMLIAQEYCTNAGKDKINELKDTIPEDKIKIYSYHYVCERR